jgi:hypothetical protein
MKIEPDFTEDGRVSEIVNGAEENVLEFVRY